jgi:hypothetical protein
MGGMGKCPREKGNGQRESKAYSDRQSCSFTEEEMKDMTDREGWAWIYANRPPGQKKRDHSLPEFCFTGFGDSVLAKTPDRARSKKPPSREFI